MIATGASLLLALVIGCGDDDGACPDVNHSSLSVQVVNGAADGECEVQVFANKGDVEEELSCSAEQDAQDCTCSGGMYGSGTYEVRVEQDGDVLATQSATTMTTGAGCDRRDMATVTFTL